MDRRDSLNLPNEMNSKIRNETQCCGEAKRKKIRRSVAKKTNNALVNIMYSNIQGFTKKKESLEYIMDEVDCDICLLAETMTRTIRMKGCRCITSNKSVGQNVCIIVRNKLIDKDIIKMYEPNDTINMIGIRVELLGSGLRVYTAHLKQQSVSTRDEIALQFEEIRKQFHDAMISNEAMIMIFDANVHLGKDVIKGCVDDQDWGGAVLLKMIEDENLILLNSIELCEGVITRVDPRNGTGTSIDVAICNQFLMPMIVEMKIDEDEMYKPTNFASIVKKTDHNTILVKTTVERCSKMRSIPYINTNDCEGRERFRKYILESDVHAYLDNTPISSAGSEFNIMQEFWNDAITTSFKKISPRKKSKPGVDKYVRELMNEEKWIRQNVHSNPERGRKISEIRKKISFEIEKNRADEILQKVAGIRDSKNPQGEVFKIRRSRKKIEKVGFPLQGKDGRTKVTKSEIDNVVIDHFDQVFRQNEVPKGKIWGEYWKLIDEVFQLMKTKNEWAVDYSLPTFEEIKELVWKTNDKKSVLGSMTSDLVKIGGDSIIGMIHRVIVACCSENKIPDEMRNERMVLLYKNKGQLTDLDNYRGIFIRLLCLSILQKWLYRKCTPLVEASGSEYAFGGRKGRSVAEVLLIVRLTQDYCNWMKQPLIMKFLDVTKFFDTMNYKKCLIEAYISGIKGKYWKLYASINERKSCTPVTPLGESPEIDVNEVFLQGSCDAMLMAWNLVDAINKSSDVYDPVVVIDGVEIPRTLFVDDILELVKSFLDLDITILGNENFEKTNRIKFKPCKCKIICCNCTPTEDVKMNNAILEVVKEHEYLGTIISAVDRRKDLEKRVKDCKGVLNEITEICRE